MVEKWMTEIRALPAKKRKHWKGRLFDKWNVAQKVRYVPEGEQIGESSYISYFKVYKQPNRGDSGGQWWPVVEESFHTLPDMKLRPVGAYGHRLLHAAETGDMWETFDDIQEETHTGEHYRNHFVKVPTEAGQPVRG